MALNTLIVLDLNTEAYSLKSRPVVEEFGVTVAASMAAHLSELRQSVGLAVLGRDQVSDEATLHVIQPARGQGGLMRLLDLLARAEMASFETRIAELLSRATAGLEWGSTVVILTAGDCAGLTEAILQLRQRGFHVWLVAMDSATPFQELKARLALIGVPAHWVTWEPEMEPWR
jgi:uncharacterized protein (DUF58 family)